MRDVTGQYEVYIDRGAAGMRDMSQYALYKGEQFITAGTLDEISAETGLTRQTLQFYGREIYKTRHEGNNKKILVSIEWEE